MTNEAKIHWINTKDVKYLPSTRLGYTIQNCGPLVNNGNWDLCRKPFIGSPPYISMKQLCIGGLPYEKTNEFARINKLHKEGKFPWKWNPKLRERSLIDLYDSINDEGIMVNPRGNDQIAVAIARDGRLALANGRHRLAMCYLLGIEKIPVIIYMRHTLWKKNMDRLRDLSKSIWGEGILYTNIDHVDAMNYKSQWDDYRIDLIKQTTSLESGTLVDIGSLFGNVCAVMEDDGFDCSAVDINSDFLHFMKLFRDAKERKFKIIKGSFHNMRNLNYDIVTAFNIFHHSLKKEKTYNCLVDFLKTLNFKEMYFQAHDTKEKQMIGAYRNFSYIEFVNFIQECLPFETERKIIGMERGRKIFKIYKD